MVSPDTQFTQLMESMRKQNDLVNSVTKALVTSLIKVGWTDRWQTFTGV